MEKAVRYSKKREAILNAIQSTTCHPSADWVYQTLKPSHPDLSLGTVYRNLSMFKDKGQIISLGSVGGVERFDGNTAPHVHFICTDCTAVTDLPAIKVPGELNREVVSQTGGQVEQCQLTFTGQCQNCLIKRKEGETA